MEQNQPRIDHFIYTIKKLNGSEQNIWMSDKMVPLCTMKELPGYSELDKNGQGKNHRRRAVESVKVILSIIIKIYYDVSTLLTEMCIRDSLTLSYSIFTDDGSQWHCRNVWFCRKHWTTLKQPGKEF